MADSSIEWTDKTWNPTVGCRPYSPGCLNCYAKRMTYRQEKMGNKQYHGLTVLHKNGQRHFNGIVRTNDAVLANPMHWKKPSMIFVDSMSDLFFGDEADKAACAAKEVRFEPVPVEYIDRVMAVAALCPRHTFQILTKRIGRMAEYFGSPYQAMTRVHAQIFGLGDPAAATSVWPLPNVILGFSAEDQATFDVRYPVAASLGLAGWRTFCSLEPMISWVRMAEWFISTRRRNGTVPLDQLIIGGESGPGSRDFDVIGAEKMIETAQRYGVPVFLKQLGSRPRLIDTGDPHGWPTTAGPVNWESGKIKLQAGKGNDMSEWPKHLRVREMARVSA